MRLSVFFFLFLFLFSSSALALDVFVSADSEVSAFRCYSIEKEFYLRNDNDVPLVLSLAVSGSAAEFMKFSDINFYLAPKEIKVFSAFYDIPCDAKEGSFDLDIYFFSEDSQKLFSQEVEVFTPDSAVVDLKNNKSEIRPCSIAVYDLLISNPTIVNESYNADLDAFKDEFSIEDSFDIGAYENRSLQLKVSPENCSLSGMFTFNLILTTENTGITKTIPLILNISSFGIPVIGEGFDRIKADYSESEALIPVKNDFDEAVVYNIAVDGPSWISVEDSVSVNASSSSQFKLFLRPSEDVEEKEFDIKFKLEVDGSDAVYFKDFVVDLDKKSLFARKPYLIYIPLGVILLLALIIFGFLVFFRSKFFRKIRTQTLKRRSRKLLKLEKDKAARSKNAVESLKHREALRKAKLEIKNKKKKEKLAAIVQKKKEKEDLKKLKLELKEKRKAERLKKKDEKRKAKLKKVEDKRKLRDEKKRSIIKDKEERLKEKIKRKEEKRKRKEEFKRRLLEYKQTIKHERLKKVESKKKDKETSSNHKKAFLKKDIPKEKESKKEKVESLKSKYKLIPISDIASPKVEKNHFWVLYIIAAIALIILFGSYGYLAIFAFIILLIFSEIMLAGKVSKRWKFVEKDTNTSFDTKWKFGVYSIDFSVKKNVEKLLINIKKLKIKVPGKTCFSGFNISSNQEDLLKISEARFRLSKRWFKKFNVSVDEFFLLKKVKDSWRRQNVELMKSEGEFYYFKTDKLSVGEYVFEGIPTPKSKKKKKFSFLWIAVIGLAALLVVQPLFAYKGIAPQVWKKDTQHSIDLDQFFIDPDLDKLTFFADKTEHVSISFSQGVAFLNPSPGWVGEEYVVFHARDNSGEVASSNPVKLIVKDSLFWNDAQIWINLIILAFLLFFVFLALFEKKKK